MSNVAILRRWHLRLSIVTAVFLVFQGITGTIAQQRFQLMALAEPDVYAVDSVLNKMLSPAEILETIRNADPEFRTAHVMYPSTSSPQTAVIVMGGRKPVGLDMSRTITVDQYSGVLLAERASSEGWVGMITGLHKWTNYGATGRIILCVFGALVAIMMLVSLRLAWLTRQYAINFDPLKKWHRRLGIFAATVFLIVSVSGVTLNLLTWAERSGGNSVVGTNMMSAMRGGAPSEIVVDVDAAYTIALNQVGPQRLAAFTEAGPHAAKHWFAFTNSNLKRVDVLVDAVDGAFSIHPSGLMNGGSGVRGWLFPIHSGYVFGWVGGLVMTILGVAVLFWPISGIVIWRRRTGG